MPNRFAALRRLRKWALWVFFVGVAGGLAAPAATAGPRDVQVAAVPPGGGDLGREVALPRVLSARHAARYVRIFELQRAGDWHAADHEVEKLDNRILMGHVLAQRYLHPTRYRSKFRELGAWLARFADHPDARRIYKLALRRKPKSARAPRRPVPPDQPGVADGEAAPKPGYVSPRKRSKAQRRKLINLIADLRKHLHSGDAVGAEKHLWKNDFRSLADDVEFDILRREVAHVYFVDGHNRKAFELAAAGAKRSGETVPLAHWTAGLAAFRLGDLAAARLHFEALATADNAGGRAIAAGAYWAARLNLIGRRPERVTRLLRIAAAYPRSFYGLLAHRALGETPEFSWELPPLTDRDMAIVVRVPAAMRALALAQVGQDRRAELELRRLSANSSPALGRAMLALATRLDLPAAQLRFARGLAALDGRRHDGAMYPMPQWQPGNGYVVDRALVFALIRQESRFNARAKSRAGARGVMQLMPRTASFIARDRRYRTSRRDELFKPEVNIELGQKYILHLLEQPKVQGNLLYLAAAYNGGPGNLKKWRRQGRFGDDALLFIETLPLRETRLFVERVLTNLWIYRARLGQAAPSLDAVASGGWPVYAPQDPTAVALTADDGD